MVFLTYPKSHVCENGISVNITQFVFVYAVKFYIEKVVEATTSKQKYHYFTSQVSKIPARKRVFEILYKFF